MKVSVPATAPPVPPDTGASIMRMPRCAAAAETLRADSGAMVLHSSTSVPRVMAVSRPSSPRYRPSTWRLAGSMVTIRSAPATASAAEAAAVAPDWTRAWTACGTRSKTRSVWPAFSRFCAIGPPMWPSPMNPMVLLMPCLL
ncbi:hypothetical protein CDEN61S_02802 [Castellaniella denitrificans]